MPKLYFYDTGLACSLLGLEKDSQVDTHYLKGALFENLTILEILKGRLNRGLQPNLYFWRDQTGHEVDLIAEWGGHIKALEIKSGSTFQKEFIKNVKYFCTLSKTSQGYLLYPGAQNGIFSDISLLPLDQIESLFF
jgi:predicted AAA+ superfamily ATPase